MTEYHFKIFRFQCKSHTEHNDTKKGVYITCLNKAYRRRCKQRQCCHRKHKNCHILSDKVTDFFHYFHFLVLLLLSYYFVRENGTLITWFGVKKSLCLQRDKG